MDLATPDAPWWFDRITAIAPELAASGFTAVLLPPVIKTSAGLYPDADGYGPYDDYDVGSKMQDEYYLSLRQQDPALGKDSLRWIQHPAVAKLPYVRQRRRLLNLQAVKDSPALQAKIAELTASIKAPDAPGVSRTMLPSPPAPTATSTPIPSPLMATRFGDRTMLQRCCAVLHANGIQVYLDMVPHQRSGGEAGVYRYTAAGGRKAGAFAKDPGCFNIYLPNGSLMPGCVERDPIAGPVADDFAFGDELCPINAVPKGYVMQGLIDAGNWITKTTGASGYRDDDVKGQAIEAVLKWSNSAAMAGKIVIGEYDDGNTNNVNWWVWGSGLNGRCYAFDFPLHYVLEAMCNNTSRWDMRQLNHAGLQGVSPANAVTFVENPDTDTDGFASIIWNKIQAYFYIMTSEGYPMVYWRDYSTDPGCYGLKPLIDNLIWIHEHYAVGPTWFRFADTQCVVYERGPGSLLAAINNDQYNGWKTVTVPTGFGPNVHLHDVTGHNQMDCWTDMWGTVTFGVPPNVNGQGTCCWVTAQNTYPANRIVSLPTTQTFFGGLQYDIGPAVNGAYNLPFPITCQQGAELAISFTADQTGWVAGSAVQFQILGPDGAQCCGGVLGNQLVGPSTASGTSEAGVHSLRVIGTSLPDSGSSFAMQVTYTAPKVVTP